VVDFTEPFDDVTQQNTHHVRRACTVQEQRESIERDQRVTEESMDSLNAQGTSA
jgi:hypothetical protein